MTWNVGGIVLTVIIVLLVLILLASTGHLHL